MNCAQSMALNVPFGGYKQSGIGRELGEYALETSVFFKYFSLIFGRPNLFLPGILKLKLFISILASDCETRSVSTRNNYRSFPSVLGRLPDVSRWWPRTTDGRRGIQRTAEEPVVRSKAGRQ